MKHNIITLGTILSIFLLSSTPADKYPEAEITNGLIRARLYLPDKEKGYYRGSRFDWAGVMPELEYQGHSYFGLWFEKYSPTLHDAIVGPVDAFTPIGYEEAKAGENFLKIGIGMVTKTEEKPYSFVTSHPITNYGVRKVKKKADQVTFTHTLDDKAYSYVYKKTVQLIKGKPEMVLVYSLKNTGKQVIETTVYNHNFFVMDKQPIGPDFVVTFPFKLITETEAPPSLGKLRDNQILFEKELVNNDHLFYRSLTGFSDKASDYDIKIENSKTGAGVRITGDLPISKLVFWSAPRTVCPEPYTMIKVTPGETVTWKILYQFYTKDTK
jgi:hypothetical protein